MAGSARLVQFYPVRVGAPPLTGAGVGVRQFMCLGWTFVMSLAASYDIAVADAVMLRVIRCLRVTISNSLY